MEVHESPIRCAPPGWPRGIRSVLCWLLIGLAAAATFPLSASAGTPVWRPARPAAATLARDSARRALPDSAAVVALLAGVHNVACPVAGVATGGQPDSAHVIALRRAGFRTVLDLRMPDEARGFDEASAMRTAGLRYVTLPMTAATLADSTFDAFRGAMAMSDTGGVFVHCASGNRVGAAMIPWLVLDRGWELERAVSATKAGGLKSPEMEARARAYVARRRSSR